MRLLGSWLLGVALATVACGGSVAPTTAPVFSRVADEGAVFGGEGMQSMESVTAGGPGLVAVGTVGPFGEQDAAVWTSSDGVNWSRVPDDGGVFGGAANQWMFDVARGGPGLVAVGLDASGGDQKAAVWVSSDGISWTATAEAGALGEGGDQAMSGVTAGGPGLVAVGWDASGGDQDAAVWTSSDGDSWSRVPDGEGGLGGAGDQSMFDVTAGGSGLVAVGAVGPSGEQDAAVWTSSNGITWSRVSGDGAVFGGNGDQRMMSVTVHGGDLVATGWDASGGDSDAAVWTSSDGTTWERSPHAAKVLGGERNQRMWSVVAEGSTLVAVGSDASGGKPGAAVWVSDDGISWFRVPQGDGAVGSDGIEMFGVTVGGPGVVAVGWDVSGDDPDAAVWIAVKEG